MKWKNVESSNVESVAHYEQDLYIKFKGGSTYRYFEVPREVYKSLLKAESVGKYIAENVKSKYTVEKISEDIT